MLRKNDFSFLFDVNIDNAVALTLTEKQHVDGLKIDDIISSQNLRHFINLLNQKVYGNSFRRHGKRLSIIPVMEFSYWHRHHLHCILKRPQMLDFEDFKQLINHCWSKTKFGHREVRTVNFPDDGWLEYMLKEYSKEDLASAIDWNNVHYVHERC